jgi:hypothetical protein
MLRVLYVGEADESGEYAVLTLSKEPEPWLELVPFDVWVGQELGALPAGARGAAAPGYEAAAKELAEATGDGRVGFSPTAGERGEADDEEEDEEEDDEDHEEDGDDAEEGDSGAHSAEEDV